MLNFTVGSVLSSDAVREIGRQQVQYFRQQNLQDQHEFKKRFNWINLFIQLIKEI